MGASRKAVGAEAVLVFAIGLNAVNGLNEQGVRVYRTEAGTVRLAPEALKAGQLAELRAGDVCHGRGGDSACAH